MNLLLVILISFTSGFAVNIETDEDVAQTIIAMERGALDRYGNGDPKGYLEIYAPEFTYFDPSLELRITGYEEIEKLLLPVTGKIHVDRYEMINPKVQVHGETAVLTYNLVSYVKEDSIRWNSTQIYVKFGDGWKLIHSHWSFTKPGPE